MGVVYRKSGRGRESVACRHVNDQPAPELGSHSYESALTSASSIEMLRPKSTTPLVGANISPGAIFFKTRYIL